MGSQTLPHAEVSRAALRAGVRAAIAAGGEVADLRGDAYGHGAWEVSDVLVAEGVRRVIVDDTALRERLTASGVEARGYGEAELDPAVMFGWPGSGLTPALRLSGRIISTKLLRAGEAVSYGYLHRAHTDTRIALVTGGYAQGIVRALGNRATVEIGGTPHPIVGRVAMDVCVVDLETPDAQDPDGAEVVFFGGTGAARDNLADWSDVTGMSVAELVTVAGMKAVRTWTA